MGAVEGNVPSQKKKREEKKKEGKNLIRKQ